MLLSIFLECADFVEGEEADAGGADNSAEGDGAETVAGVVGVGAFAVVAGDEDFAGGNANIELARSVGFWSVFGGFVGGLVRAEAIGVFVVVDG